MEPTQRIRLPDGRDLAIDDVGDPDGVPVIYVHGTPDSRLARHPDDGIAAACGVRLLALDRPGSGCSDPHPEGALTSLGDDLVLVLDQLGIEEAALLGWSAGGLFGLAAASILGARARRVVLVGTLPPVEAYGDAGVVRSLGARRRPFVELAAEVPAAELAAEVAPHMLPLPLTRELALEHVLESAGDRGRAELAAVPGALDQMAEALLASVEQGLGGVVRDVELQLSPGLDLGRVDAAVTTIHGEDDDVSPPTVGQWLAANIADASVVVMPAAGHHLLFPRWEQLLRAAAHGDAMPGGIASS